MPLALSVLYFDPEHQLQAYDDIRVGGTGLAQVSLNRRVADGAPPAAAAQPSRHPNLLKRSPTITGRRMIGH